MSCTFQSTEDVKQTDLSIHTAQLGASIKSYIGFLCELVLKPNSCEKNIFLNIHPNLGFKMDFNHSSVYKIQIKNLLCMNERFSYCIFLIYLVALELNCFSFKNKIWK